MSFVHMGGWLGRNELLSTTRALATTAAIAAALSIALATATALSLAPTIATTAAEAAGLRLCANRGDDHLPNWLLRALQPLRAGRRHGPWGGPRTHHVHMAG